jgi:hypothetical protein
VADIVGPTGGVTTPPDDSLFPEFDGVVAEHERRAEEEAARLAGLSAGQRLTLRQAADVAAGRHPLTGGPLHPLASRHRDADAPKSDPFTCGSCYFRNSAAYHGKSYAKCWLPGPRTGETYTVGTVTMTMGYPRVTHGPASDVRAWWPACPDHSPGDSMSPDAARYIPGDDA